MLTSTNIGISGSTFEAARRKGFLDKARQSSENRDLVSDRFPLRDGVDLLVGNFGKDYADGYRLGVSQSSQIVEEEKTPDGGGVTVGEAFRFNIMNIITTC